MPDLDDCARRRQPRGQGGGVCPQRIDPQGKRRTFSECRHDSLRAPGTQRRRQRIAHRERHPVGNRHRPAAVSRQHREPSLPVLRRAQTVLPVTAQPFRQAQVPAQYRIDVARGAARYQRDRLADGGVVRHAIHIYQLGQPQPQRPQPGQ